MSLLPFQRSDYPDDRRLARLVLKGDQQALTRFMDEYFPRLYRFALLRLNQDASDAEDVVQMTLTIAARRISTYRGEASLLTWLMQICRRELVRFQKQNQRRDSLITLFEDETFMMSLVESLGSAGHANDEPLDLTAREELINMVHLVLDQLPNRQGDVLEWKYIEGLSLKEIAARLDIGGEAVQSLLARARRSFKAAFGEFYSTYGSEP